MVDDNVRVPRWLTRNDIAAAPEWRTGGYWYLPGQMLVHNDDVEAVRSDLSELGVDSAVDRANVEAGLQFSCVTCAGGEHGFSDTGVMLARLRSEPRRAVPRISPNHVFVGEPVYAGGPGTVVTTSTALAPVADGPGAGVVVGVLDTGLRVDHPWLQGFASPPQATPGSAEVPDCENDGLLDAQAGHGTFVAGVVLQEAPGAQVLVSQVLSSKGLGTEDVIAREIVELGRRVDILNLSLGGYCEDDVPPPGLVDALAQLDPDVVVVAAAGNDGRSRPFFPAASKRVVGVGAIDRDGRPAPFTNRGPWVDACAYGVGERSSFLDFRGRLEADPATELTFEGFATWSGTSFAAPRVSGKLAALLSKRPGTKGRDAVHELLAGSRPRLPGLGVVVE